jgi:hypothetical protein
LIAASAVRFAFEPPSLCFAFGVFMTNDQAPRWLQLVVLIVALVALALMLLPALRNLFAG